MPFTAEELAEMARADAEIEADFAETAEEIADAERRDDSLLAAQMTESERRRAEYLRKYRAEHREERLEYQHNYYQTHKEIYAAHRERYRRQKQLLKASTDANAPLTPEQEAKREKNRKYYAENKDRINARRRERNQEHRLKVREYNRNYKRMLRGSKKK